MPVDDVLRKGALSSPVASPTGKNNSVDVPKTSSTNPENIIVVFLQLVHMELRSKTVDRQEVHIGLDLARARCAPALLPKQFAPMSSYAG